MPKDTTAKPQSMEEFGPVSVDYFNGQRVESVQERKEGGWSIVFESGGVITNYDPTIGKPTAIVGAALTRVILEAKRTRLQFGLEQVILNPIEYSMTDAIHTNGIEVYAQRSDANMPGLPPHPDERVAEHPQDPADAVQEPVDHDVSPSEEEEDK